MTQPALSADSYKTTRFLFSSSLKRVSLPIMSDYKSDKSDMHDAQVFAERDIDVAAQLAADSEIVAIDPEAAARLKSVVASVARGIEF